jgi:GR25 family glycosyltransferase involved in LPS biosynthesis
MKNSNARAVFINHYLIHISYMDQILIYTTLGYNPKYLDIFKLFCESLCYTTATQKNLLVLTDEKFVNEARAIVSKYALLNAFIHPVPNSDSPESASKHKTRIYEFPQIYNFRICLYVDVDCLFLNDLQSIFKFPVQDSKLYVYPESTDQNDHKVRFFSLQHKDGSSFYTTDDYNFLIKNKKLPFNAGLFLFKITKNNENNFNKLQTFMKDFDGVGFYEQSYMNTFFNLNDMSDFSYFTTTIAMQSTHTIDEKFVKTTTSLKNVFKPITPAHAILHFNATLAGNGLTKYNGMKLYFEDFCSTHKYKQLTFDNRNEMLPQIVSENAVIAEIGVFKGDFASVLLKTNPSHLYLVDIWEPKPVVSGDVDGNNVERYNGADLYKHVCNKFRFNGNVSIHRQLSFEFLRALPDNSLDAVYIDADHSYEGVKKDLELSLYKVKKYGLIMGHDYEMNMKKAKNTYDFGVKRAVDEFCKKYSLSIYAKANDGCVSYAILNTYEPPPAPYQIICISVNNDRKNAFAAQCGALCENTPLVFVDTTRDESYFPANTPSNVKNLMDCAHNHFKALEIASRAQSSDFSIICEDDALFHKTDFLRTVNELIANWYEYMGSDKIASIGWVPLQNYKVYDSFKSIKTLDSYRLFNNFYAYGLQAYVVNKRDIASYIPKLLHSTYEKYSNYIKTLPEVPKDCDVMLSDFILPRLLGQRALFPPIAIESNVVSHLEHTNAKHWDIFFKGYESLKMNYYNPTRFQLIVVSASEKRRAHVRYQCERVCPSVPLYFIEPDDQPSYVPASATNEERKVMYCTRSHFKALKFAAKPESPAFSVILEDDVAFHKTDFIPTIHEFIRNWSELMGGDKMASIGWIPCNNYDSYKSAKGIKTLESIRDSKILNDRFVLGTQAYIVKKDEITPYVNILLQPTYEAYETAVRAQKYPNFEPGCKLIACDVVLPRILGQRILFPPVAIETQTESIIGHTQNVYWNTYFKNHSHLLNSYYAVVDDPIQKYFTTYPELNMFKTFKQVIIWGYPLHSHTHSYIHNAWFLMFQALKIPVYWFYDADYPKDFDYTNSCFITEGWVDKNIPLLASCTYFVHIATFPQKYVNAGARLIEIRYNVDTIDDYNYKYTLPTSATKLSKDSLYEVVDNDSAVAAKRGREPQKVSYEVMYMYWATDILPHEFDFNDASRIHENTLYHIGSLESGHPLIEFASMLEASNIKFNHINPWKSPVSYKDNIVLMKKSYCCPDFRNYKGVDVDRTGYVPCRVFKAISYGHTGITNSKRMKSILGDYVEYVESLADILPTVEKRRHDVAWRIECMQYIAANHTFLNRAVDLARALNMKKKPSLAIRE